VKREAIPAGTGKAKKQVVFFDAAPPVSQRGGGGGGEGEGEGEGKVARRKKENAALGLVRRLTKRTLSLLSNLPLAISEMFAIAALMALGDSLLI
jgi:cytochrome c biogenesis protein